MENKIIAFDPGATTGYAVGIVSAPRDFILEKVGQVSWDERFLMPKLVEEVMPGIIVAENFRLYRHAAQHQINSEFPSPQVIGILGLIAYMNGVQLHLQPASIMSNVKVLPKHEDMVRGYGMHIIDAYKHLRYYVLLNHHKHFRPTI